MGQELEKTDPKQTKGLESPHLVMLQQTWQCLSRERGKGCVSLFLRPQQVELESPPSQNLDSGQNHWAGQEPCPGDRAGLARGWPGLERVLESSPRFPGVSGVFIALDMSCSSCCMTAVAESSTIYSQLQGEPWGFPCSSTLCAADVLQR